jgi:hypothetical protein
LGNKALESLQKKNDLSIVEILRKLLNCSEEFEKYINEDLILQILLFLRLQSTNRDLVISALRVIAKVLDD